MGFCSLFHQYNSHFGDRFVRLWSFMRCIIIVLPKSKRKVKQSLETFCVPCSPWAHHETGMYVSVTVSRLDPYLPSVVTLSTVNVFSSDSTCKFRPRPSDPNAEQDSDPIFVRNACMYIYEWRCTMCSRVRHGIRMIALSFETSLAFLHQALFYLCLPQ